MNILGKLALLIINLSICIILATSKNLPVMGVIVMASLLTTYCVGKKSGKERWQGHSMSIFDFKRMLDGYTRRNVDLYLVIHESIGIDQIVTYLFVRDFDKSFGCTVIGNLKLPPGTYHWMNGLLTSQDGKVCYVESQRHGSEWLKSSTFVNCRPGLILAS